MLAERNESNVKQRFQYRYKILKCLLPYATNARKYVVMLIFFNIFALIIDLLNPVVYQFFIDDVVLGGQIARFWVVVLGYLGLFATSTIIKYGSYYLKTYFGNDLLLNIKSRILQNALLLPHEKYEHFNTGEAKTKIEDDTKHLKIFFDSQCVGLGTSYATLIVCSVLLFVIDYRLALYSIAVIPVTILVDYVLSLQEKNLNNSTRINNSQVSKWLQDSVKGWREIRTLGLQKYQQRIFLKYIEKHAVLFGKWINYWTARVLVLPEIQNKLFSQLGLYFFGGILIMNHQMKIGELLVFVMYFEKLSKAVKNISTCDAELIANKPHSDSVLQELHEISEREFISQRITSCEEIQVSNVSFSYPGANAEVLERVNLKIKKGDRIAIVGKCGSGKSTLIKLICGLLQPKEGYILYNNILHKEINIDSLHERIGLIMQENTLYHCSIRENLYYAKSDASESEIEDACRKACIWEYINGLPDGLDTVVGERGINFSAGQRQRIVLARTFLKSPDIYVFDEATSNLDVCNESLVYDALRSISNDKIVLIITHRTSVWGLCNKIYSVETKSYI